MDNKYITIDELVRTIIVTGYRGGAVRIRIGCKIGYRFKINGTKIDNYRTIHRCHLPFLAYLLPFDIPLRILCYRGI